MILNIVNYPLDSERETVSEQFQGSWRLGTAQALHAQYRSVSSVNIRHLGTPYERVPRFLIHGWNSARFRRCPVFFAWATPGRGHQGAVGRPRKANLLTPQPAPASYDLTGPDEDIEDI